MPARRQDLPHQLDAGRLHRALLSHDRQARAAATSPELSLPVAFTVFPGEIFEAPRSWAEEVYPNLIYWNEAEKGGHFAAWEEPQLFAEEMRAAFTSLRNGR